MIENLGTHGNEGAGLSFAVCHGFAGDIHHAGPPGAVVVGKFFRHGSLCGRYLTWTSSRQDARFTWLSRRMGSHSPAIDLLTVRQDTT